MTQYTRLLRVAVVLLFVISFTLVGWAAPIMYASHAPPNWFIEVHGFDAADANPESDRHTICLNRTIHTETTGKTITELYLVSGDQQTRVSSDVTDRYFQEGTQTTLSATGLPSELREGEYRYLLVVRMNLVNDQLTRDFTFESEPFVVNEDVPEHPPRISC